MDNFSFVNQTDFETLPEDSIVNWINELCGCYNFKTGPISYLFCDDDYLLMINKQYLNHDTLTDIITFDYTLGKTVSADILISLERVSDNARLFNVEYRQELTRVMAHGLLHCMGFKDKTKAETEQMREAEEKAIQLLDKQ